MDRALVYAPAPLTDSHDCDLCLGPGAVRLGLVSAAIKLGVGSRDELVAALRHEAFVPGS